VGSRLGASSTILKRDFNDIGSTRERGQQSFARCPAAFNPAPETALLVALQQDAEIIPERFPIKPPFPPAQVTATPITAQNSNFLSRGHNDIAPWRG
jgi:hypothetical protein